MTDDISPALDSAPPDVAALAAGLRQLCAAAERALAVPGFAYHCVVVPDDGAHDYRSFDRVDDLVAHLRTLYDQDVHALVFYGRACGFTPRPVYLQTHEGAYPLFDVAGAGDAAAHPAGYLGRPGAGAAPAAPATGEEEDDDDGEDEGEDKGDEYGDGEDI